MLLAGAYVDWGGEGFGARFGVNALSTDLGSIPVEGQADPVAVDTSGQGAYLDLRWAF